MRSHPEQTTSPPLMVHAVRARGRGTEGVGGHSGRSPGAAGKRCLEDVSDSPDGAARLPEPGVGDQISPADPRTEEELDREPRGPGLVGLLSVRPPGRQARRPAAWAAVGLGWDSARTGIPELEALRSAPWGRDLLRALPAADPTQHEHTQCPRAVSAPPAGAFTLRGAQSSPSLCSEKGAWEGVRRPGGNRHRGSSRSA